MGGAIAPLDAMWALTRLWYADRLAPDYEPAPIEMLQGYLEDLGFSSPFWQLARQ